MILNMKMTSVFLTIAMLLLPTLTVFATSPIAEAQLGQASLTGTIYDRGVDTDGNGKYDYLEIAVEVNVTEAGEFTVEINSFVNESGSQLNVYDSSFNHLETGLSNMTLLFYGPMFNHASFDPMNISRVTLDRQYGWIETLFDVPLSRMYDHTEFDVEAFFTKEVSSSGIDRDGNGLFDVLQVGVELNVVDSGEYLVSAWGLLDETDPNNVEYFYDGQALQENFSAGVQTLLFNFSGPGIAEAHINPTAIESIAIITFDVKFKYNQLDQLSRVTLPGSYTYTMFDVPSKDVDLGLTVYPDGSLGADLLANYTHMYPSNSGPLVNSTLIISKSDNLTIGSTNCTFSLPSSMEDALGSMDGHMQTTYQNDILNSTVSATLFLPPQARTIYPFNSTDLMFDADYANGVLNAHVSGETVVPMFESTFPFNASDLTIFADYDGAALKGNVTFHVVSGFPLTDIRTDFQGNRTNIVFTGNVNVTYGAIGDLQINSTVLDEIIVNLTQITGQGPDSLYNMTFGMLEATDLNTNKIPWGDPEMGADVTYAVTVEGNFTGLLGKLVAEAMRDQYGDTERMSQIAYAAMESVTSSLNEAHVILNYYHNTGTGSIVSLDLACDAKAFWNKALTLIPPTLPPENATQLHAVLRMANATAYAVQDFALTASLSSSELKIVASASIVLNETQLKADTLPFVPDTVPPQMHDTFESILNTSYASLESMTATFDMTNGTGNFSEEWTMQGDMSTELNRGIHLYLDMLNITSPGVELPPPLSLLNGTDIDLDNLRFQMNLGEDALFLNLTGLILQPTVDHEDLIRFRLQNWFERLQDAYGYQQGTQKLRVNVIGGFDSTHIVLLNPSSLPSSPDSYKLDYTSMTWQNTTFSNMDNLQFLIAYDAKVTYATTTYHVPIFTNSDVTNVTFLSGLNTLRFEVTGQNGTGFCNVTIPRNFIYATLDGWKIRLDGVYLTQENFSVSENAEYAFLYLNYTHSTHTIEIEGTSAVAELQPNLLPIVLAAIALTAAAITIVRRKHAEPETPAKE